MVKHIQTIRRQSAEELFEGVWALKGLTHFWLKDLAVFSRGIKWERGS